MEQKICIHFQTYFIKSFMDLDRIARYRYTGFFREDTFHFGNGKTYKDTKLI